ncbi:branched-chain amino acid ABC transporter permease [Roseomonas sp. GCM10028921]
MSKAGLALSLFGIALVGALPLIDTGFWLALAINVAQYAVLATAWAMFSGPTRYVSLATAAFFGIGAYAVAVLGEALPWPLVLLVAGVIGAVMSLLVGFATLRLSGVYFVVFTFGLAELIRQLVTWFEVNVTRSMGRYVFVEVTQAEILWQLLALFAALLLLGTWLQRSRLGFALRVIGEDETVARHVGIDTARAKVALFALSSVFMALTGAVMAPRWTYLDPAIAFNPSISFTVLIMALLGGTQGLLAPLLGVVPLAMLFEVLTARFPNHFSILVGMVFLLVVYVLPQGVSGLLARRRAA